MASLPEPKQTDMRQLHKLILSLMPNCRMWFLDGKDSSGKVISNPNIGYGNHKIHYKDGTTKDFYQIGISANTTGISVYIMGITDKNYLANTFGPSIGKATVSGYCIKFKKLQDIALDVLESAIRFGAN